MILTFLCPGLADLAVRYPVSFNDYSIHADFGLYRDKFILARDSFAEVYNAVKDKVENSMRFVHPLMRGI